MYIAIAFNEYRGTPLEDTYGAIIGYDSSHEALEAIRFIAGIKDQNPERLLYDGPNFVAAQEAIAHLKTFEDFMNEQEGQFLDDKLVDETRDFSPTRFSQN